MALIVVPGATAFCMDKTEVARAQYKTFVAAGDKPAPRREACKANMAFEAAAACLALEAPCSGEVCDTRPQVCIDYCDAEAFCAWSGKTLCGTDDGRELTKAQLKDPWATVWQRSCRGLGREADKGSAFPYGDEPKPNACNVAHRAGTGCLAAPNTCTSVPVGTLPECRSRGAYSEIMDLGGNVSEYLYAVIPSALDGAPLAQAAGANYIAYADDNLERCANNAGEGGIPLSQGREYLGFRCCARPR